MKTNLDRFHLAFRSAFAVLAAAPMLSAAEPAALAPAKEASSVPSVDDAPSPDKLASPEVPAEVPAEPTPPEVPAEPAAPTTAAELEARKQIAYKTPSDADVNGKTAAIAGSLPQSPNRISLPEAVRVTLLNDPVIRLANEDVQMNEALLQILGGTYDWTLSTQVDWQRKIMELDSSTEKRIKSDFDKQNAIITSVRKERKRLNDELNKLAKGQGLDGTFSADPNNRTEEADLTAELTAAIVDSVKSLLPPGAELDNLNAIEGKINEQAIATRESILETLETTEKAAHDFKKKFPPASNLRSETYSFTTQLAKQFKNGVVLQPFATYTGTEDDQRRRAGQPRVNRGDIGLELIMPLGAGRGTVATYGQSMAQQIQLDASQFSFYHTLSERVEATVEAYWNLVAAQERLALRVRSEIMNGSLVALGREMIGADVIAQSELPQMVARQLASVGQRIQAEIELESAQRLLAVTMGLNGDSLVYAPLAAESFPSLVSPASYDRAKLKSYIAEAFNRRNDRLSSLMSEDASLILVEQAHRNLAPRADLVVRGFLSGQSEGAQADNWGDYYYGGMAGSGVAVGFRMDWPFANNSAKGVLSQREVDFRVQQLNSRLTEQSIIREICTAEFLVYSSASLHATQKQSMDEFGKALEAEREKFQLGEVTSLNVLQTEESLTGAALSVIDARLRNAVALARLRHGTGTLLPALKADVTMPVERYRLTTAPVFADPVPALPQAVQARGGLDRFLTNTFGDIDPYANVEKIKSKGTNIPPLNPVFAEEQAQPPVAVPAAK